MAVVIRLRRAGSKKRPFYHMVVADSRMRRDGRFIEKVGYYNPIPRHEEIEFDAERVETWIAKGAKPTTTVDRLMRRKQRGVVIPSQKDRKRDQAADARAIAAEASAKIEAEAKAKAKIEAEAQAKIDAAAKVSAEAEAKASAEAASTEAETPPGDDTAATPAGSDESADSDANKQES